MSASQVKENQKKYGLNGKDIHSFLNNCIDRNDFMVDVCRSVICGLDAAQFVNCVSHSSKDSVTASTQLL